MRLIYTVQARYDLRDIRAWIARDSPIRGKSFTDELRAHCRRIALNPMGYRTRSDLGAGLRSCAHGNYVILFTVDGQTTVIIRVLHGARDLPGVVMGAMSED